MRLARMTFLVPVFAIMTMTSRCHKSLTVALIS